MVDQRMASYCKCVELKSTLSNVVQCNAYHMFEKQPYDISDPSVPLKCNSTARYPPGSQTIH